MSITTLWRRKGQHHAGTLRAQLVATQAKLTATQDGLATAKKHAKAQSWRITELETGDRALKRAIEEISLQLTTVETAHDLLLGCYDELAARYTELQQENDGLRANASPAPADDQPTAGPGAYDPDATAENVRPLWDAVGQPAFAGAVRVA